MKKKRTDIRAMAQFIRQFVDDSQGKICIFTDYDGTLTPSRRLKNALIRTKSKVIGNNQEKKFILIANTGRLPKDFVNQLNKEGIPPQLFNYKLGNNGATSPFGNESISKENIQKIIKKFIKIGGNIEDIRIISDNIYAHNNDKSKKYYKDNTDINYFEDLEDMLRIIRKGEIVKITLTSNQDIIDTLIKHIKEENIECATHKGNTRYRREQEEYRKRVDITPKYCNKGSITQKMVEKLEPKTFMVMGNDENDIPMLKYAIDKDAYIVLVEYEGNITENIKREMQYYAKSKSKTWRNIKFLQIPPEEMNNLIYMIGTTQTDKEQGFLRAIRYHYPQKRGTKLPNAKRKTNIFIPYKEER